MMNCFQSAASRRTLYFLIFAAVWLAVGCGKKNSAHSVTITWNPSNSPVVGYNVYRSSPPDGFVKLTNATITETRYIDKNVEPGRTYAYYVTSVDSRGIESKASDTITATVPTTSTPRSNQ
jgi:fibronectin type 3 domain-containing protein